MSNEEHLPDMEDTQPLGQGKSGEAPAPLPEWLEGLEGEIESRLGNTENGNLRDSAPGDGNSEVGAPPRFEGDPGQRSDPAGYSDPGEVPPADEKQEEQVAAEMNQPGSETGLVTEPVAIPPQDALQEEVTAGDLNQGVEEPGSETTETPATPASTMEEVESFLAADEERLLPGTQSVLDASLHHARGLVEQNDAPAAVAAFRDLLAFAPDPELVADEVREFASRAPDRADVWGLLGDCEVKTGNLQAALDAYTNAENLLF